MEKHNPYVFCEYEVKSWDDARKLLVHLSDWVFRGQSNKDWKLQTTLERASIVNNADIRAIPLFEKKIIERFQRRALYYLDKVPETSNLLEWISLIQHHGGPTRLLDFTYSYYVATYFSIESALQDSALFCLNKNLVYSNGLETEKWRGCDKGSNFGTIQYCNSALNEQTLSPLVMLIEPFNMHERLSRQQGLFALPFEGRQAFEYNLSLTVSKFQKDLPVSYKLDNFEDFLEVLKDDCVLLKIVIPKKHHSEIRRDLLSMNITTETLFPGIDGFAKSLINEFNN